MFLITAGWVQLQLIPPWLGEVKVSCYCSPGGLHWHHREGTGGLVINSENTNSLLGLYWHYRNGELEGCIITDERAYKSSSLYGLYCSYRFKGSSVSPNRDENLGSLAHLLYHDPCGRRGVMVSPYCLATVEIWSTHLTFDVGSGSRSTDFLWCLSGEERSKSYVLLRLSPFYCFGLKDKGFLIFIFDCICWHF